MIENLSPVAIERIYKELFHMFEVKVNQLNIERFDDAYFADGEDSLHYIGVRIDMLKQNGKIPGRINPLEEKFADIRMLDDTFFIDSWDGVKSKTKISDQMEEKYQKLVNEELAKVSKKLAEAHSKKCEARKVVFGG